MKFKSLVVATAIGLMVSGPANALFIDLGGVVVDGDALNQFTVNNPNSNAVVDITFDFVYEAGGAAFGNESWGSELILEVFHVDSGSAGQIGTQAVSCDDFGLICEFDLMWDDATGIFTAMGGFSFLTPIVDGSGDWIITVADSFDDLESMVNFWMVPSFPSIRNELECLPHPH